MNKEYVLDIGIGAGGTYIKQNTKENETRIGVDMTRAAVREGRRDFPEVLFANAHANKLPFQDSLFSRIEMVLPDGELAFAGLQYDHFLLKRMIEEGARFPNKPRHGWYPEFSRVLKPRGELLIYGDFYVDPDQVRDTASEHFDAIQARQISVRRFLSLGTHNAKDLYRRFRGSILLDVEDNWENRLV